MSSPLATARPPAASIWRTTCCAADCVAADPVDAAAQVVDHDRRAARREQQGVGAAQAAAGAGDDRDASFEIDRVHAFSLMVAGSGC